MVQSTYNTTAIVTGANSGIGFAICKGLLLRGVRVIMACRNLQRAEEAKTRLIDETRIKNLDLVEIMICDLSSMKSINEFIQTFKEKYNWLDLIFNCAGHISFKRELTSEGIEKNFATNVLGPYYLTKQLIPLLIKDSPTSIVNVAGEFHRFFNIDFENLLYEKKFSALRVGSVSMLERIMLTYDLAVKLEKTKISVNCYHPGTVYTELIDKLPFPFPIISKFMRPFMLTPDQGADTALWLTTQKITGKYFIKRQSVLSSKFSYDVDAQKKLSAYCDSLLKM